MKIRSLGAAALLLCLAAPEALAQGAPAGFREEFRGQFGASMSKLVALAEAMPAETYAWSPGEGVMPVAQVYAHIARYNYLYPTGNLGAAVPPGVDLEAMEGVREKAEVVALLKRSGEFVEEALSGMSDADLARGTRLYGREVQSWAVLFQLVAHMNEHLGQSIAYARSNGIVPPWSR